MALSVPSDDPADVDNRRLSIPTANRSRRNSSITPDEMDQLKNEFLGLDADGNGEIEIDELEHLLQSMKIKLTLSDSRIRRALKQADKNGDGTVDIQELVDIMERFDTKGVIYKALHQRSVIRKEFEKFDADESGFITKDELLQVIKDRTGISVSEKLVIQLMKDCDENDDDQIDYEEFVTLMTKSCMQRRVYTPSSSPKYTPSSSPKK